VPTKQVGDQLLDRPPGQAVAARENGQDRPQEAAERPVRYARREFRTGGDPAAGASQPVQSVFIDVGADGRDLSRGFAGSVTMS
jgi:hypothetical protein